MDAQDQLTRLERSVSRLEALVEILDERQKKCEDNGERITRIEEREALRARVMAFVSALFGSIGAMMMRWWDGLHLVHH